MLVSWIDAGAPSLIRRVLRILCKLPFINHFRNNWRNFRAGLGLARGLLSFLVCGSEQRASPELLEGTKGALWHTTIL
jgi:hypothetical protein